MRYYLLLSISLVTFCSLNGQNSGNTTSYSLDTIILEKKMRPICSLNYSEYDVPIYYPDGNYIFTNGSNKLAQGLFKDSLREGEWFLYYDDGKIFATSYYENGIEIGQAVAYFHTGELKVKAICQDSTKKITHYTKSGDIELVEIYRNYGEIKLVLNSKNQIVFHDSTYINHELDLELIFQCNFDYNNSNTIETMTLHIFSADKKQHISEFIKIKFDANGIKTEINGKRNIEFIDPKKNDIKEILYKDEIELLLKNYNY